MATNPDDQPIKPIARALTIREAELATGINSRSIRRRLAAGTFPGAFKDADRDRPNARVWRIPVEDLEAAGLGPVDLERRAEQEPALSVITPPEPPPRPTPEASVRREVAASTVAAEGPAGAADEERLEAEQRAPGVVPGQGEAAGRAGGVRRSAVSADLPGGRSLDARGRPGSVARRRIRRTRARRRRRRSRAVLENRGRRRGRPRQQLEAPI